MRIHRSSFQSSTQTTEMVTRFGTQLWIASRTTTTCCTTAVVYHSRFWRNSTVKKSGSPVGLGSVPTSPLTTHWLTNLSKRLAATSISLSIFAFTRRPLMATLPPAIRTGQRSSNTFTTPKYSSRLSTSTLIRTLTLIRRPWNSLAMQNSSPTS